MHFQILISNLFLKLVNNIYCSFQLKLNLLYMFRYILEDPTILAFYYVNYDLNNQHFSILEQIFLSHSNFISLTFHQKTSIDSEEKFYCKGYSHHNWKDLKKTYIRSIENFLTTFYNKIKLFYNMEKKNNYMRYLKTKNLHMRKNST